MSSASNISNLPTDPAGGGSIGGNVQITATEQNKMIDSMQQQLTANSRGITQPDVSTKREGGIELSQSTIAELVSGIQKVSKTGNTTLPSRDIPMNESNVATDEGVKPNYIPPTENTDYIKDYEENNNIIRNYEKKAERVQQAEDLYEELQTPIIVMLVYFLFQLPAFKKYERKLIPGLFGSDFNINTYGVIFNSVLIGLIVFIVRRLIQNI
jgi:hypothetical protein